MSREWRDPYLSSPFLGCVPLDRAGQPRWQCRGWHCPCRCLQLFGTIGTCWSSGKLPKLHKKTSALPGLPGTELDVIKPNLVQSKRTSTVRYILRSLQLHVFTHCGKEKQRPSAIAVRHGSSYWGRQELQQGKQRPNETWKTRWEGNK